MPSFLEVFFEVVELGVEVVESRGDLAWLHIDLCDVITPAVQIGHSLTRLKESIIPFWLLFDYADEIWLKFDQATIMTTPRVQHLVKSKPVLFVFDTKSNQLLHSLYFSLA